MQLPHSRPNSFHVALGLASSAVLLAGPSSANTLHVRAWIDGRSQLVLQGDTARWDHFDFAAPGRLNCDTGTPIEPTYLGGATWFPSWPDTDSCENRFCDCSSDVFTGLAPSIPEVPIAVGLSVVQARSAVWIVEQPSAVNGWRLVVEFDDNPLGGADWYEIDLLLAAAPPCAEWSVAQDFVLAPGEENPGSDQCANADVWHYFQSDAATFPSRDPSTFTLLAQHATSMFGVDGLESWQGDESQPNGLPNLPNVAFNATGDHVSVLGIEWPQDVLAVHPASNRHVVVGWRSPWTGLVSISGSLQDLDATCASTTDGVRWFLDHFDGVTSTNVAFGAIADNGGQDLRQGAGGGSMAAFTVEEGDFLLLVVDKVDGLGCDTTGLDLVVRPLSSGVPFCFGDGLGATPTTDCPCANFGAPGRGCGNSVNPDGARLVALGTVAQNDVVLFADGMPSTVACIFLQGDGLVDAVLNDGVRCVGGTLRRLRVRQNIQGTSSFPDENDVWTLSERGLVTPGSGALRHYQAYYRNASVSFCPSGVSNLTNGWTIVW